MLRIMICPVCKEPVAEDPRQYLVGPGRGADRYPRVHLADGTPICFGEDGKRCHAVFTEEVVPVDNEARAWLDAMAGLFDSDGLHSPGRLGTAISAAEHLHHWLYTASGPLGALTSMPTPAEVALLVGHLYRTLRLLARIQTQAGTRFIRLVRQQPAVDDEDVRGARAELRVHAHDSRELLDTAAALTTDSAGYSAAAWSYARRATIAWAVALPGQPPDELTVVDQADYQPGDEGDADAGSGQEWPGGLTHAQLGELIGVAYGDDATFSPELTDNAARATGTLVTYLAACLGRAGTTAIPTPGDLASLATSLTYLSHTLADGLRRVTHRQPASDNRAPDGSDAAAIRTSLDKAADGLRIAGRHLTAAAYTAAGIRPPGDPR